MPDFWPPEAMLENHVGRTGGGKRGKRTEVEGRVQKDQEGYRWL
jgi:hypothetical protein